MYKLKIPAGWYRLRNGTIKQEGDRFKKQNGYWTKTSDYGNRVAADYPDNPIYPEYSGVYIRRIKRKARK